MKKLLCRIGIFVLTFCAVYLACCYLIPGWRLKLAADPITYFWATVGSMVPLKTGISLAAALAVSVVLQLMKKR